MGLCAVGWSREFRFALFADLADFKRFLDALHEVCSVIEPGERFDLFKFFASKRLVRRIKRKSGQQNLISLPKGLNPGTGINLQAVEVFGFGFARLLVFIDPDFSDMNSDPVEHRLANLSRERSKPSL